MRADSQRCNAAAACFGQAFLGGADGTPHMLGQPFPRPNRGRTWTCTSVRGSSAAISVVGRTPWELHFAARSRRDAAYLGRIESLAQRSCCGQLVTHFDDENQGVPPDLGAIVTAAPPGTHFYCCGPQGMLKAYEKATASVPPDLVHLERFAAEAPTGAAATFQVQLARSGMQLTIPPDRTILDVLLEHGINAPYGCMQGSCGMCETAVIDGTPAHGDMLLSDEEKAKNDKLLICCSRSLSPVLTLDL